MTIQASLKGLLGEAGHDPGVGRQQPSRPGDCGQGWAVCRDPSPHPADRRLRRRPDRVRRDESAQGHPADEGHFDKAGVTPRRHTVELRTADASEYTLGQELTVELFEPGQVVDVVGTSKGKGFPGGEAARFLRPARLSRCPAQAPLAGLHRRVRHPGQVFRGQRMAGRMGGRR